MKFLVQALLIATVAMAFAACSKNDEKKNNEVVAQPPPMDNSCIAGQVNCNQQLYNQYNQFGFRAYGVNPYNYNNGYYGYWMNRRNPYFNRFARMGFNNGIGFCNCPVGYRPVYNGGMGLGCVAANYIEPFAGGALYFGLQVQSDNYHWVNIAQVSNLSGYPSRNTCYDNVAQSCFVDQPGSCGAGSVCRPTAGGSRLGICTR